MAFNAGTVKGALELQVQKFKQSVEKATSGFKKMGKAAKDAGDDVKRYGNDFSSTFKKVLVAVAGAVVIRKTFNTIKNAMMGASKAQQQYEQSVSDLKATLQQGGAAGAELDRLTASLEKYAAQVQATTGFKDVDVLGVAQTLKAVGVADDKLQEFTGNVLDYAAKMRRDPVESAKQFGRTLSGMTGELGEVFPAIRALGAEALKMGGAFTAAGQQMGGFAAEVGGTTENRIKRMQNAFTDLSKRVGEVVNQFLGPLATALQEVFTDVASGLKEGTGSFESFVGLVRTGFETALWAVNSLVEGIYQVRVVFNQAQLGAAMMQAGFVNAITSVDQAIINMRTRLFEIIMGIAEFVASVPGLSQGVKDAVQSVADFFGEQVRQNREAVSGFQRMKEAAAQVVEERKKDVAAAEASLAALRNQEKTENAIHNLAVGIRGIEIQRTTEKQKQANQDGRQLETSQKIRGSLQERLVHLREINGVMGYAGVKAAETANNTKAIGDAASAAKDDVGRVADEFGRAADNAERAAAAGTGLGAAGGGGGGGGGGSAGPSASRGTLGRKTLDFSDPFRAVSMAQNAQQTLGRISRGGMNVFFGAIPRNAARAFADGVRQEAEAAVDRALSSFTASVISELNQQGIMDPAERSRIVKERIAEAERLGVIPSTSALEVSTQLFMQ